MTVSIVRGSLASDLRKAVEETRQLTDPRGSENLPYRVPGERELLLQVLKNQQTIMEGLRGLLE
jgi:hypothetical protein